MRPVRTTSLDPELFFAAPVHGGSRFDFTITVDAGLAAKSEIFLVTDSCEQPHRVEKEQDLFPPLFPFQVFFTRNDTNPATGTHAVTMAVEILMDATMQRNSVLVSFTAKVRSFWNDDLFLFEILECNRGHILKPIPQHQKSEHHHNYGRRFNDEDGNWRFKDFPPNPMAF